MLDSVLDYKYTLGPDQDRLVHTGTDPGQDHRDEEGSGASGI